MCKEHTLKIQRVSPVIPTPKLSNTQTPLRLRPITRAPIDF